MKTRRATVRAVKINGGSKRFAVRLPPHPPVVRLRLSSYNQIVLLKSRRTYGDFSSTRMEGKILRCADNSTASTLLRCQSSPVPMIPITKFPSPSLKAASLKSSKPISTAIGRCSMGRQGRNDVHHRPAGAWRASDASCRVMVRWNRRSTSRCALRTDEPI